MCVATLTDGEFDPELCPMLAGFSPAERARRLEQPWVKACIERRKASMASRGGAVESVAELRQSCPAIKDENRLEPQTT